MLQRLKHHAARGLRWSEQYTKTDMIYLTKGGFWLTLSKILSTLASFLSSVAFANLLPEETYGVFRYVLSIVSLLAIPTLHGIDSALARAISRGHEVSTQRALFTRVKWGILGGLGSIALGGYYYISGNETLSVIFLFIAIFIPVMDPLHIYTAMLNGLKKFNTLAQDEILTRLLTALLLIATVFYTQNIFILIAVYFVSHIFFRFVLLQITLRKYAYSGTDTHATAETISYGKHLTAMSILGQISVQLDKILLFHYAGGAMLAAYYLAFVPFKQIQTMFSGLTTLAFPKFADNTMANIRSTLPGKLLRLYGILIPIVVLYILAAPYLFALIYPQYMSAVFPSQLLMLQLLFFPFALISAALTSHAHKKKLYINSTTYAVIRVALLAFLVPPFGIYGAITAILATALISNGILLILFLKR